LSSSKAVWTDACRTVTAPAQADVRRVQQIQTFTIAWMCVEATLSLWAAWVARCNYSRMKSHSHLAVMEIHSNFETTLAKLKHQTQRAFFPCLWYASLIPDIPRNIAASSWSHDWFLHSSASIGVWSFFRWSEPRAGSVFFRTLLLLIPAIVLPRSPASRNVHRAVTARSRRRPERDSPSRNSSGTRS